MGASLVLDLMHRQMDHVHSRRKLCPGVAHRQRLPAQQFEFSGLSADGGNESGDPMLCLLFRPSHSDYLGACLECHKLRLGQDLVAHDDHRFSRAILTTIVTP